MTLDVRVEPVTARNWREATAIRVSDEQRAFLDTPDIEEFLADASQHPTYTPCDIYDGETVVGIVSYGYLPEDLSRWWVPLLVIDRHHQRRGYARAAMRTVIDKIRREAPKCGAIGLSYKPANLVAERLYLSLGFEKTGETDERGEVYAWLRLAASE